MICKTSNAGIKMIFQSISSQPVLSETKAKLTERNKQSSIVFIIILFLVVLIFEIKLNVFVFFIQSFARINTNLNLCKDISLRETVKA